MACKDKHNLPVGINLILIQEEELVKESVVTMTYHAKMCPQCEDPQCLKACQANAIYKDNNGFILIDERKCIGCGNCVTSCPFNAIFIYPEQKKAIKCDGCVEEIKNGEMPCCVQACPMNCLTYENKPLND